MHEFHVSRSYIHNRLLSVVLVAQLLEHCTTSQKSGFESRAGQFFFFLGLTRYYLLLGSYIENSQLCNFGSLFNEFNLQIIQIGQIGENRFWESRYFIPQKPPEDKLAKKMLSKEKRLCMKSIKEEKNKYLCT